MRQYGEHWCEKCQGVFNIKQLCHGQQDVKLALCFFVAESYENASYTDVHNLFHNLVVLVFLRYFNEGLGKGVLFRAVGVPKLCVPPCTPHSVSNICYYKHNLYHFCSIPQIPLFLSVLLNQLNSTFVLINSVSQLFPIFIFERSYQGLIFIASHIIY